MKEKGTVLLMVISIITIGYFLNRTQFWLLLTGLSVLFISYGSIVVPILKGKSTMNDKKLNTWVWLSIGFRFLLLFSIPSLSDDFYRFIWDGSMFTLGKNPYMILPDDFIQASGVENFPLAERLYTKMNSPQYYTVYPPIMQAMFSLSAILCPNSLLGSVMVLRSFILLSEIGTIVIIRKLLIHLKMNPVLVLVYALNPLVIFELTGNLHTEAVMIFFLALSMLLLFNKKWIQSALIMGFSISAKLIPLMFLPVLIIYAGWRRSLQYYVITGATVVALFLPYFDGEMMANIFSSVNLYFQTFEFNASFYYLVRWVGYETIGYNIIQWAGPVLSVLTFIIILVLLFSNRNRRPVDIIRSLLFALSCYLFLSTTIHPWYVTTLVMLAVFVKQNNYVLLWSATVMLSYFTYIGNQYHENMIVVFIEYILVFGMLFWELLRTHGNNKQSITGND